MFLQYYATQTLRYDRSTGWVSLTALFATRFGAGPRTGGATRPPVPADQLVSDFAAVRGLVVEQPSGHLHHAVFRVRQLLALSLCGHKKVKIC